MLFSNYFFSKILTISKQGDFEAENAYYIPGIAYLLYHQLKYQHKYIQIIGPLLAIKGNLTAPIMSTYHM